MMVQPKMLGPFTEQLSIDDIDPEYIKMRGLVMTDLFFDKTRMFNANQNIPSVSLSVFPCSDRNAPV